MMRHCALPSSRSGRIGAALLAMAGGVAFSAGQSLPSAADTGSSAPTSGASQRAGIRIPELELELMWIAPGTFKMGSPPDERQRHQSEGPQLMVVLSDGFWLGRTEVTQEQYARVAGANPSHFKEVGPGAPVERVSWIDAMEFCRKLTEREQSAGRLPEGYVFTLPTEAQWEYAHRAGTTDEYVGSPDRMAWYDQNSGGTTHPVAMKEPNPWGLYDMAGNVVEWCYDWYGEYPRGQAVDPAGPKRGHYRTARGGSWRAEAHVGRSAARGGGSIAREDYTLGFRIALSRPPTPK